MHDIRLPAILLAGLLGIASCGCLGPGASQLTGTWEMQTPDAIEAGQGNQGTPGDTEGVVDNTSALYDGVAYGESAGNMSLVFHRNGSLETITNFPVASSHKFWRWSMVSWDAASQVAVVRCQMSHESVETTITFVDQNTIQLIPPNIDVLQTELRFVRK